MFNPINFISKFIKSSNQKELDRLIKIVSKVNKHESRLEKLKNEDFPIKTKEFKDPDRISLVEQEITCDFKNADMALIPHPFQGTSLTGRTIILIDPCSDVALRAEEMKEAGEGALDELF